MLHFISWKVYGISLLVGLLFFYGYVGYKNFRLLRILVRRLWVAARKEGPEGKKREEEAPKRGEEKAPKSAGPVAVLLAVLLPMAGWTQTADGAAGINQANSMIRSYFDPAVNLMYAAGALAGIYGGYKVYRSMSTKDHEADQKAGAWLGACIFLVLVATVLKSFFGI
ncbi:MAG TPA: DUF4134 domain-containing protein [Puia sp.]